jgi:hypothetical protein
MKQTHRSTNASLALVALLLFGCAVPPPHPDVPPPRAEAEFSNLVLTGRISSRIALPASKTQGTATNSIVLVGGRAYWTKSASPGWQLLEASYLYEIELPADPSKRARVVVTADYPIGACVDLKTLEPPPEDKLTFPEREAVLLPSSRCPK